jgi:hypothetical protein
MLGSEHHKKQTETWHYYEWPMGRKIVMAILALISQNSYRKIKEYMSVSKHR